GKNVSGCRLEFEVEGRVPGLQGCQFSPGSVAGSVDDHFSRGGERDELGEIEPLQEAEAEPVRSLVKGGGGFDRLPETAGCLSKLEVADRLGLQGGGDECGGRRP